MNGLSLAFVPKLKGYKVRCVMSDNASEERTAILRAYGAEIVYSEGLKGTNGSTAAIAAGDILYYVAANTPKLSTTTTGVRFGYAMAAVTSGLSDNA